MSMNELSLGTVHGCVRARDNRSLSLAACLMCVGTVTATAQLTTPQQFFGHEIGADYMLPNYQQLTEYWRILEAESDRMTMVDIGAARSRRRLE
jgi:hypothetical protein